MLSEGRPNLPTQGTKDRALDLAYNQAMEQLLSLT